MFAVAVLVPSVLLGAVAWGVVGVLRQRGREEFTLATAAAFYAQLMSLAGLLAVLAGAGLLVKLGLSLIDPAYAYTIPPAEGYGSGYPSVHVQQVQDLIQAGMLTGIGALVVVGHGLLAHFVHAQPGGAPAWVVRGTLIALTVFTGLAGFLSAVVGGYQVLTYFIVGSQPNGPFAEVAGVALVFIPAWAVVMALLVHQLRGPHPRAAAAMTAA
ncbi:MAG TPA: hypothetical protein VOB72_05900 [Candidatus Dormibacteraeota bacterium]|nr:hypothetical protein [Candidatus Dormibacteraeota bacterium]